MIKNETIQEIVETARIEEVVGDFVKLKKRGTNFIGLCPFHNEKTPSFSVSPVKGIYKCFGCGKAGNVVNFVMEHEHYTYPEALRYLASKYQIEIEEEKQTPEMEEAQNEREVLLNLSAFAQKYFSNTLFFAEEGKAIGMTYFKERGFREDTIKAFELGYSPKDWDSFTKHALNEGYKLDYLVKSGLTVAKDKKYDRFRARVIFPIHNITGRVIGFGGRILTSEKNKPKYLNSPESEIYNKRKILYGLFQAKKDIIQKDNCYLVEGYTDVVSLHQAGIKNVVASSGTSLTTEQIRLIKRYSQNITILYDGDEAGIKAAFRGIDMILEEDMNVRIVLFPDGEDPDSYARGHRTAEVEEFVTQNAADFITFKTKLLSKEAANDPIKKAALIREIITSIAAIPDRISRSVYVKECSALLDINEDVLLTELNKMFRKKLRDKNKNIQPEEIPEEKITALSQQVEEEAFTAEFQEKEIIRLMLQYGQTIINETEEEDGSSVAEYIINDLTDDDITFDKEIYQKIFSLYKTKLDEGRIPDTSFFVHHTDEDIVRTAVDLLANPYELSNRYEKEFIEVRTETKDLPYTVRRCVLAFKAKKVEKLLLDLQKKLKEEDNEEEMLILMNQIKTYKEICDKINGEELGRTITS